LLLSGADLAELEVLGVGVDATWDGDERDGCGEAGERVPLRRDGDDDDDVGGRMAGERAFEREWERPRRAGSARRLPFLCLVLFSSPLLLSNSNAPQPLSLPLTNGGERSGVTGADRRRWLGVGKERGGVGGTTETAGGEPRGLCLRRLDIMATLKQQK